ncbi:hypothetical protein BDE02_01G190900 [Populus trichocarpa]|nr:hypothetical protein BDE02_01G190900 [Populus trichocarpa]
MIHHIMATRRMDTTMMMVMVITMTTTTIYDDNNNGDMDTGYDDGGGEDFLACRSQQRCKEPEIIRQRQEADITRISTVLSISRNKASLLLRLYGWNVIKVEDEWFGNEEEVRNISY